MSTNFRSSAAGLGVDALAASALSTLAATAPAGPDDGLSVPASCPDNGWSNKDSGTDTATTSANTRTRPGTGGTSVGQAQPGQVLDLHCFKSGDGGTWSHVRNTVTGKQGWIKDSPLRNGGSFTLC
jgi:hypothetical protein